MKPGRCLNCETKLRGKFCHNCGQKASTHRIDMSSFVQHDLVHGVWHLDSSIFHTLGMLFFRPGHAVKRFLLGKRVNSFNIFALLVIVVTLKSLLETWYQGDAPTVSAYDPELVDEANRVNDALMHYNKFFYLLGIPLLASFTRMYFRKLHYNFAEHMVVACYLLAGGMLYALLLLLTCMAAGWEFTDAYSGMLIGGYSLIALYQVSSEHYRWYNSIIRGLLTVVCFLISSLLIFLIVLAIMGGGGFTGNINI